MESITHKENDATYRIRSIPAYYAQRFLSDGERESPEFTEEEVIYLMSYVDFKDGKDYVPLDSEELIDSLVPDWECLDRLISVVYNHNFGFMREWKVWRIPSLHGFVGSDPRQLSPFIHTIIVNGFATLSELKTSCSLRDAFEMQDSLLTKAMNEYRFSQMRGVS